MRSLIIFLILIVSPSCNSKHQFVCEDEKFKFVSGRTRIKFFDERSGEGINDFQVSFSYRATEEPLWLLFKSDRLINPNKEGIIDVSADSLFNKYYGFKQDSVDIAFKKRGYHITYFRVPTKSSKFCAYVLADSIEESYHSTIKKFNN